MVTKVKTADEINSMRESGKMLATVLQKLKLELQVGMSTKDLSDIAAKELKQLGGEAAFLGYQDFPDVS
jgi:methionyl aminopeptidase